MGKELTSEVTWTTNSAGRVDWKPTLSCENNAFGGAGRDSSELLGGADEGIDRK